MPIQSHGVGSLQRLPARLDEQACVAHRAQDVARRTQRRRGAAVSSTAGAGGEANNIDCTAGSTQSRWGCTTELFQWGPYPIHPRPPRILDAYAIHHDPSHHPDPKFFVAERWEGKLESTTILTDERLGPRSELFAFGAGSTCRGARIVPHYLSVAVDMWICGYVIRARLDTRARGKRSG